MQITVTHWTSYQYDVPVFLEPHIFRLRPRASDAQRLLAFDLQISPVPAGSTECLDQDGSLALNAWFSGSTTELRVTSRFTVDMLRWNPFDYLLSGPPMQLPQWYPDPLSAALAPYRLNGHVTPSVQGYAERVAAEVGFQTLPFLTTLSARINREFPQIVRPSGSAWRSEQTLREREGSCRDLAVLYCDCCRAMGLAARFVSGYECASAGTRHAYMHAWAEVYLQGIGWRGYDPARGLAVSNGHVAVAAGFDPELASPIAGWFSGWSGSRMDSSLIMEVNYGG